MVVNLPLFILQHNRMHKVKIIVLRNVTPCNLVDRYQCCGDMCCLHLQDGWAVSPWRRRQQVPPKQWHLSTKLHSITFPKTVGVKLSLCMLWRHMIKWRYNSMYS